MRGITGLSLRVTEPKEQHGPTARIVRGGLVEEIERTPVPAQSLVGRKLRQRAIARPLRVRDRLARVLRLGGVRPVVGELSDPLAGIVATDLIERLSDHPVAPSPPPGGKPVVEGMLDQRVGERVAAGFDRPR